MANELVHVIRYGLIKCEIFLKQTQSGPRFNCSITRLFRNGESWQESHYFGRDEVIVAAKALDHAHTWIISQNPHAISANKQEVPS